MSVPSVVKGQFFNVAVESEPGSGDYVTICGLNTRSFTEQVNTSDETYRDCEDPYQVPWRVINTNSQQMDISGTGFHNRAQATLVRTLLGKSLNYRFILGEPFNDAVDEGFYQGLFVLTNRQVGATDGANVTAQFTWASDGQITYTATSAIIPVLASITATPLTADAGDPYTATLAGKTEGSTITATSGDGTALTVTGNTLTGEFATTGSKAVTLIETLAGATGSPKTSTATVVVS